MMLSVPVSGYLLVLIVKPSVILAVSAIITILVAVVLYAPTMLTLVISILTAVIPTRSILIGPVLAGITIWLILIVPILAITVVSISVAFVTLVPGAILIVRALRILRCTGDESRAANRDSQA